MHRNRSRLQGGHKVGGAPHPLTRTTYGQTSSGPTQGLQTQYGASTQSRHPPPPPSQQPLMQQQQPPDNGWGWDSESSSAWNWGEGGEGWSTGAPQQSQQHYLQNYSQPHAYPPPSQPSQQRPQQQFATPAEVTTYSHVQHTAASQPETQPQPQYVNGSSQNGNTADDWGSWGEDWGSVDTYNNNVNNNNSSISNMSANFGKQETSSENHQNYAYQQQMFHQQQQQQQRHQQQEQYHQKEAQKLHQNQYPPQQQQYAPQKPQEQPTENSEPLSHQQYNAHYQHQSAQPQHEGTQQQKSANDNWGWENEDWQVNGQVTEQPQKPVTPQPSHPPQQAVSKESAGQRETSAVHATSTAGDGWPDWEEQTHTAASHVSQQQQQEPHSHTVEPASYPGSEEGVQTEQDASQWTRQQWKGSWGQDDTREAAADHQSVTRAAADTTTVTSSTTTITTEHPSYAQCDSYQQELAENAGKFAMPDEQQHQSAQQEHHSTTAATTAPEASVGHGERETTTTMSLTNLQTSTVMMNNFDDDNWGDGWGEVEAPQAPHTSSEPTSLPPASVDSHDYVHHYPEVQEPTGGTENSSHDLKSSHAESCPHMDQPDTHSPKDNVLLEDSHLSTYTNEGTSEAWDKAWDKMSEPVIDIPSETAVSGYSVHAMTRELAAVTLKNHLIVEGSFSQASVSEESSSRPTVNEVSSFQPTVGEVSSFQSTVGEVSSFQSTVGEVSSFQPTVSEVSSFQPTVSEVSSFQPTISEVSSFQPTVSEVSSFQPTVSEVSSSLPTVSEESSFQPTVSEESSFQPTVSEESSSQPTVSEESSFQPTVSEESSRPTVSEESYSHPTASEGHFSRFTGTEESYTHSAVAEESYTEEFSQSPASEDLYSQHPMRNEIHTHPAASEGSLFHLPHSDEFPSSRTSDELSYPPSSEESYSHPTIVGEPAYHPPPVMEGYHHHSTSKEEFTHPPGVERTFTHPPVTVHPPFITHQPSVTYLDQGTEGSAMDNTVEPHAEAPAPSLHQIPFQQPPPPQPQPSPPPSHLPTPPQPQSSPSPSHQPPPPEPQPSPPPSHLPPPPQPQTSPPPSHLPPPPQPHTSPPPSHLPPPLQPQPSPPPSHLPPPPQPQPSPSPSHLPPPPQPQTSPPPSHQPASPQPQQSPSPPQWSSAYQTSHYLPQTMQEPIPQPHVTVPSQHQTHLGHNPHDPHRPREVHHLHHPSPSPSPHAPQPHPHQPSPSPSPHIPLSHPHRPSHTPSPQQAPQAQPQYPSPSPSPHAPPPYPHHEASALEVNQEVVAPPPLSQPDVPDPIYSRIPDGASSIPEGPPALTVMSSDRQRQSHMAEASRQAGSAGSGSAADVLPEHQFVPHPPHPSHPPVERPASNQSAHSVHSVHSVRSTHSTHSVHSSHSLTLNQEVPLDEEAETWASSTASDHHGDHGGVVESGGAARPLSEGAAAPSSLPQTLPQIPGPLGAVQSLKPRKGSPFQSPAGKDSPSGSAHPQSYQYQPPGDDPMPAKPPAAYPDVSANLETLPDNNELITSVTDQSGPPLWSTTDAMTSVKLLVPAPPIDATSVPISTTAQAPPPSNAIPLVVPGLVKEERCKEAPTALQQPSRGTHPDPPAAHSANMQATIAKPKIQSFSALAATTTPSSPAVLDLSKPSTVLLETATADDRRQEERETPNFSRMVPGESRKGESAAAAPAFQTPAVVPSMPSERVVTGNDNPQPVVAVGIKQEPSEVRSPPDGPDTSRLPSQAAPVVVPPIRSETIGSEEPKLRNFSSGNSGSRSDLTGDRGERGGGRWEREHSRDRGGDAGSHRGASDRYRDRSRERGSTRDYYREDSPHSRHSYDRDYDDRRRWRGRDSDEDEDSDQRFYDSRNRRDRAYRDEMDRYSDHPSREDGKERRDGSGSKRRDYKDRSKDSYRSGGYDDDPYYGGGSGRGDRSQPLSRSSSINNLDETDPRSSHHRHHRSHHHHPHDYYDRRDSRSRDSDPRGRDASYTSRDNRDYYQRGWESRDVRRDHQGYYGSSRGYEDMYEQYRHYYYNQYYKDYYDWMKQCHKAYPSESFYDDRTSIHSGRSSVNNEPEKSVSSQFLQDFHGTSGLGHFEPSPIYPEGSLSQLKSYPSGELSGVPSMGDDTVSEAAQRMTPVHFGRPHISARFTPSGQLVLVLPKDPRDGEKAVVQLRDVQKMLCVDPTESRVIQQMKCYPGPLTLSDTHKDVVMRHCEHQAAEAGKSLTLLDRESVMLIWEYLALLVKQNGKLFGSDVARLLLKGREVGSPPTHTNSHVEEPPEDEPSDTSPQDEGIDLPSQSPATVPARNESALLRKFTEYLCLGRKKEAVDYAIREGLWGHALALAYKMDSTTHTRVLSAFMSHIPHTDVVLTLFQQLSGKKPEITKSYNPELWGDWRQHLAVMISNPTGASHKDRASIVALGDTLAAQGQLHAAHFCYLVAEVEWGSYTCKDSKLVLIGASHHLPFQAFATIEAIQCTEVYEFARSLDGKSSPLLETFQSYKLVYALKLTECGFPAEALRYCEVITQSVEKNPTAYKVEFLSQVYGLACRLKYHDLHYQMYQGEVSEIPDPQWLANLRNMLDTARQQEHQQLMELQDTTRTDDIHSYPQIYHQDQGRQNINQTVDVDPNYSMTENSQTHIHHMETQRMGYNAPGLPYQQPDSLYTSQPTSDVPDSSHYAASSRSPSKSVEATPMNPSHPQSVMGLPQEEGPSAGDAPMMLQPSPEHSHYPHDTTNYQGTYQKQEPYMQPSKQSGGEGEQQQNMSNDTSLSRPGGQGSYTSYQQQQQSYQPWGQPQPAEGGGVPPQPDAPSRSPEPPATQQRTPEEEAYWAEMSNKKGGSNSSSKEEPSKEDKSEDNKRSNSGKESKTSSANKGGWFTSLLGWKSSTPQAVLPDDKNPKIVWDEKRKTWVNTDGSEEATHAVGPPPKIPQAIRGPPPSVSRSGNRMTRYVDPVREKSGGAPTGTQPAPMLPPIPMDSPSASPSLIVPPPMQPTQEDTEAGDNPSQPQPQSQPQQQPSAPAPAPVPEVAQMRRTRYISESSIDLEDDWPPAKTEGTLNEEVRGPVPMMAPPMGQPQFFDPSQFKPASSSPTNPARRTGPGRRSFPANR